MPDAAPPVRLLLTIDGDPSDPEQIDAVARQLSRELRQLDVESVEPASAGAAPPGAKAGEAMAVGTVMVTLLPVMVPKVVEFLQAWVLRGAGRTVKIRAASGDRSFDLEYSPGVTSEGELKDLLATLSKALETNRGG